MTYVLIVWQFVRKHWHVVAIVGAVLASLGGSYGMGHRFGYREGFHAGAALNPTVTLKEECHATIEAPRCEVHTPEIVVKYVRVPGEPASCPPVPEVSIGSGSAIASAGSATSGVHTEIVGGNLPSVAARDSDTGGSSRLWRLSGLVGAGGSGMEYGGTIARQLGPFEAGLYVRIPPHDVAHASGGVTLGFRF